MAETIKIGGELESTATGNVVASTNHIKDRNKDKYQSDINAETDVTLANHTTAINGLNSQNYVTVTATDQTTVVTDVLPAIGSVDTVYRVGNWDGSQYDVTKYSEYAWNGSDYIHLSTKTQIGDVFDISAYHATGGTLATYDNLEDALGTNGKNIPQSLKKGGMSVKFVQSSDNNYVQFLCIADEFTADTTKWAICDDGVLIDNPEWIRVVIDKDGRILAGIKSDGSVEWSLGVPTPIREMIKKGDDTKVDKEDGKSLVDAEFSEGISYIENPEFECVYTDYENKILFGVQKDGNIYYGAGVPQQVVDYINEKLEELSLDEYEDIVAFLSDLEKGDKTLQTLLDEKVDKEEGKSLINAEYASTKSTIDNPEFLEVTLDAEDKVLEGIKQDGTKVVGRDLNVGGDIKVLGNMEVSGISYRIIESPEYIAAWLDAKDKVIFGFKTDGKTYIGDAAFLSDIENIKAFLANITDKNIDWDALSSIIAVENPEFIDVETDSEGKILSSRDNDGVKKEYVGFETPKVSIGGVSTETIDDPEGRSEVTTDAENKIVSYRKEDGTLVENAGIETNRLELTEQGMNDFQQALKNAGFRSGGGGDWSDKEIVELPHPARYAILNLHIGQLPKYKGEVKEGYAEYYDGLGNYFKKAVKLETQGQSSRQFAMTGNRGNYTLNIDDGSEIKFGFWVPQDSFHLKGTPKDVTHGILATSYKWAYMFMEYLNAKPNRVLLKDSSKITTTNASGDRFTDWIDDARCLPDGFPVEIYVEGEYWGLYALQLKKHRKNYSIKKSDYTSLFIDADNMLDSDWQHGFWLDGPDSAPAGTTGKTWWNYFDIKGPKNLVCMDGSAFDGDNPKELIDSTSPVYDSSNKKHKGSAQAKAIIRGFSTKYLEVKELIDNNNIEGAKAKFNENFDYNACMLVYIFNCLMRNGDSIKKNTLWGTWKNGKIAPMLWDIDGVYGTDWWGGTCGAPGAGMWAGSYATSAWPLSFMWTLYQDEIKATYAELRSHGIIDMNTWKSIVFGWANQIGTEAFDRDIKKWSEMPSYRENYTNTEYWQEYGSSSAYSTYPAWDENTSYSVGDIVVIKIHPQVGWYLRYRAVQASDAQNPQPPVTKLYNACPQVGGYYDSPRRMEKWMEEQIRLCDVVMEYN